MKNADRLMLRRQFLVPEIPITMAPKLDKIMDDECQSGVKCTDTALARLQALTLDAIGPLSDLEKLATCGNSSLNLQVVEDTVQSALVLQGNTSTQFSMYHRTKVLEDFSKNLISFVEEKGLFHIYMALLLQSRLLITWSKWRHSRKPKENQKGFFEAPLAKAGEVARGNRPYSWAGVGHGQQLRGTLRSTPKKLK